MRDDILAAIAEIQQPRSRFQLERFVVGQHDTIEMAYYQTCIELQNLLFTYQTVKLEVRKAEVEIARLRATGDEVDEIDAQIKELGLQQTRLAMVGAEREIEALVEIFDAFPTQFTREQIEAAQPEYWQARLTRQTEMQALGQGHVEWSQIDAMRQAGLLESYIEKRERAAQAALPASDGEV